MNSTAKKLTIAATATLCALSGAFGWSVMSDEASASSAGDGTTSTTAGASCWGIKQQFPQSPNGIYWLQTAQLGAPQQFRCDMTTEGGGWVLVGRGRDGWSWSPDGQGSKSSVRDTFEGTAAFRPAALSTATIDALLGGTPLKDLPDGVRIRRAQNEAGTAYDEWRFRFADRTTWTWGLGGGWKLASTVVNGSSYSGGNTRDTAVSVGGNIASGLLNVQNPRLVTAATYWGNPRQGFFGGTAVPGSNNTSSYIYNPDGTLGMGFTQVWIRPRLTSSTWPSIPAAGLAAVTGNTKLSNRPEVIDWGVTGIDHTNEERMEPYNTPVMDIEVAGGRAFVGGRFKEVRRGSTGTPVPQPFLAAFDEATGEFVSTFRPTLDGRVWDIVEVPGNRIIIGGDFTNVNGAANTAGLAMLDQTTGAVITTWKGNIRRVDATGRRAIVRAIDLEGGFLYVAGNFNKYQGGTWNEITVSRAVKINVTNGNPVSTWKPQFPASPVDIDASPRGDRVYLVGFFKSTNGDVSKRFVAIVDPNTGANINGLNQWSGETVYGDRYQQTVLEIGDRVVVGGAEHILQMFNRSDFARIETGIATRGGDFQETVSIGDRVYATCHCADFYFRGTRTFSTYPASYAEANRIIYVAAFDPTNLVQDDEFAPDISGNGDGMWALEGDSKSCLWVGGQLIGAGGRWAGGFAKFCPKDGAAPAVPTGLTATLVDGNDVRLKWNTAGNDATVRYWVYRDDRPIAEVYSNAYTDMDITGSHTYWVAAVDAADNRSASTPGVAAGVAPPAPPSLLPMGSSWTWAAASEAIGPNWVADGFVGSTGSAQLGWGDGDEATVINGSPLTHYFRTQAIIPNDPALKAVTVNLKRDDGAAVYVGDIEVLRSNLPDGTLTAGTPASSYLSGADENAVVTQLVPLALGLAPGSHNVGAELHQPVAGNGDGTFDLSIEQVAPSADATAPSVPTPTATPAADAVTINWPAATDDVAIGGYFVTGPSTKRILPPNATGFTVSGLAAGSSHPFSVRAFDTAGNLSSTATITAGPNGPLTVLAKKANWKWIYPATAPAADWAQKVFDDAAWATGAAEFGYGDGDESTVISTQAAPRPITAYFRTTVDIADPASFGGFKLNAIRDDGIVVYVNGVEVGRNNMGAGVVTATTPSASSIDTRSIETTPVVFDIPKTAFVPGANVIAVEVHNNHQWSGDLSFDAELVANR